MFLQIRQLNVLLLYQDDIVRGNDKFVLKMKEEESFINMSYYYVILDNNNKRTNQPVEPVVMVAKDDKIWPLISGSQ